jgi:hypothetical protein
MVWSLDPALPVVKLGRADRSGNDDRGRDADQRRGAPGLRSSGADATRVDPMIVLREE